MAEIITANVQKLGNEELGNSCKENEFKCPSHMTQEHDGLSEVNKDPTMNSLFIKCERKDPDTDSDPRFNKSPNHICSTPNKVNNLTGFDDTNCADKNTNSPQKNIHLVNQKDLLKSPAFKSPVFKKSDKSVDITPVDTCPQRKRTISINSDCDTFKLELCDIENFNNFESIDLLHDLDSVVKFEHGNDVLLSSMRDDNLSEDSEVNKDPTTDPLFISDSEKKNLDTTSDSDEQFNKKRKLRIELRPRVKRKNKCHFKKRKSNTEEEYLSEKLKNFEEWEEIPLINIKKLMDLHVKLTHEVSPQHKIEVSGSHAPTRTAKILFQKHGPVRNGPYTPTEDNIIRKNWEMFCELHDWDAKTVEPFLYWRHNGRYFIRDVKERQKFVQFLANGLPWRTLYSVYSRFKVLYRNKITTRYTSKEDKIILKYIQNKHLKKHDTKFSELGKILKRTSRSIFMRYQHLKNQAQDRSDTEPLVDIRWTLPLIKKFIKTLLNVTLSEDIRDLKDATLPKPVWQKMETKLNIHENVLRTFWQHQLHLQLFSTDPIYLNDIKIQLIEYMYAKGISNTREIIWPNVAKYFDGATGVFLCKVFYYLVQECNMSDVDNFVGNKISKLSLINVMHTAYIYYMRIFMLQMLWNTYIILKFLKFERP
ncbi:uncharacterized protein LOC112466541 isoform X1 [Temnothorax curvispinosus]|uniref:Uncharacterized protein LOC112466541 isoform X1 n=2 Tax=Temnothorax curvispinosus TaxID=300111 RepID=A0A6J1RCC8_9HYME|nr:uncharacterized protein LOC112466541 isoform X1 [Temnothorax curvispinosus]